MSETPLTLDVVFEKERNNTWQVYLVLDPSFYAHVENLDQAYEKAYELAETLLSRMNTPTRPYRIEWKIVDTCANSDNG